MKCYFIALFKGKIVNVISYDYEERVLRDKTFDFWDNMLKEGRHLSGCEFDEIQKFDKVY